MNQILISEKLYVTPELKRKKKMYKLDFFISIFLVCILFSYYIYAEYNKNKDEEKSQEILSGLTFAENLADDTTISFEDNAVVVILNSDDNYEVIVEEPPAPEEIPEEVIERNTSKSASGQEYYTIATVNIPSINCHYPILASASGENGYNYANIDELLKMSPCYFWGSKPNEKGNFCVVGHNYRNTKFFSKVPTLENGSIIEIKDLTGRVVKYQVYDKYIVDPDDVSCTSQLTDGRTEVTIITCTNDSKHRVIVKAKATE